MTGDKLGHNKLFDYILCYLRCLAKQKQRFLLVSPFAKSTFLKIYIHDNIFSNASIVSTELNKH